MDFNINKYLSKKVIDNTLQPENTLKNIFQEYLVDIKPNNIQFQKGVVYLKELSPQEKLTIKLHKNSILEKAKNQDIDIRDII